MKTITDFDKLLTRFLAVITALLIFRVVYSGTLHYLFLGWNIFLAWVPYILSSFFKDYRESKRWKQVFLFGSWLLFFPNALYIVTDLVHLRKDHNMPWWYDSCLVFLASFTGLLMAFISLRRAEQFLLSSFSKKTVTICIPVLIFIASFGVYLGRFERWNSWDVVNNPLALGLNIVFIIINPMEHLSVWFITMLLTIIYSLLYTSIKKIPRAISEIKNTGH